MCAYFPEHLDVILYDFIGVWLIHDLTQGPGNTTCYCTRKKSALAGFFRTCPAPHQEATATDWYRLLTSEDLQTMSELRLAGQVDEVAFKEFIFAPEKSNVRNRRVFILGWHLFNA